MKKYIPESRGSGYIGTVNRKVMCLSRLEIHPNIKGENICRRHIGLQLCDIRTQVWHGKLDSWKKNPFGK